MLNTYLDSSSLPIIISSDFLDSAITPALDRSAPCISQIMVKVKATAFIS